jgi:hypothetical protein
MGGHVRHCALTGKYQDPIQAPANNRRAWLRQVHNACTYTKGLVVCQDVVTELFTPAGYNMVGILPELLEVARQADPKTPKFLNELLMMPDRNWGTLFDLIEKYPVEGIAIQIHADVRDDFSEISSRLKEIGSEVKDRGLRLHVSEVQIVCPPGEEMARLHAEVHLNLFELSHAAGAECYIVWGDNDNCARIPRTTISTYSSGFHDGKSPIALKPVFKALLWHPSRTLYPG